MAIRMRLAACALASAGAVWCQTPAGSISGTIQDSSGGALSKAVVEVSAQPTGPGAAFTPFKTSVFTSAGGAYSVTGLANGTYQICPHLPNSTLLPTCLWQAAPTVTVSGGALVTAPTIQLQPSADLWVRVNDPNGTRATTEGKAPGAGLMLAVRAPNGRVIPIPQTAADAIGADQHLSVPVATSLPFVAYSSYYTMTDSLGNAIAKAAGLALTVNIPAAQGQQKVTIGIQ
jgi:Carboxypeptidase regulatory-like domain